MEHLEPSTLHEEPTSLHLPTLQKEGFQSTFRRTFLAGPNGQVGADPYATPQAEIPLY